MNDKQIPVFVKAGKLARKQIDEGLCVLLTVSIQEFSLS